MVLYSLRAFAHSLRSPGGHQAYFIYLVTGLAFGSNALSIASGGNVDFVTGWGAVSGILRLTFGYYEYDAFVADYTGAGYVGYTSDFWCVP